MAEEDDEGGAIEADDFMRFIGSLMTNSRNSNQEGQTSTQTNSSNQPTAQPGPSRRGNIFQQVGFGHTLF